MAKDRNRDRKPMHPYNELCSVWLCPHERARRKAAADPDLATIGERARSGHVGRRGPNLHDHPQGAFLGNPRTNRPGLTQYDGGTWRLDA